MQRALTHARSMSEERFTIIRIIRKGPNTGDYEALDAASGSKVNIRRCFLSPAAEADTSWHQSFLEMGASLAKLKHPNLLGVNEVGFDDDGPYISCELVKVRSIFKVYPDGVSNEMFFKAARQILSALEEIHQQGLVHGAVVVDSLQVRESDQGNEFLIYDLGMHWVKNTLRGEAYSYQDPVFTPPEFMLDPQATTQSDVYMFGHLLYCLWAGAHPLGGLSMAEAMLKHKDHDFPPVRKIRRNVPRDWSNWLDLLTSPDLSKRPVDATAALACMPNMLGAAIKPQTSLLASVNAAAKAFFMLLPRH